MSQSATIYGDKTVLIQKLFIKIFKYYFPLGTSKTIFFSQIDHIVYHPAQKINPIWGSNCEHLNNWFPLDELRKYKRGYFQIIMKNKSIRPSFSPIDPEAAFQVLWNHHSLQSKQYASNISNATNHTIGLSKVIDQANETLRQGSEERSLNDSSIEIDSIDNRKSASTEDDFILFGTAQKMSGSRVAFRDLTNKNEINLDKLQVNLKNSFHRQDDDIDFNDDSDLEKQNNMLLEEQQFENLA